MERAACDCLVRALLRESRYDEALSLIDGWLWFHRVGHATDWSPSDRPPEGDRPAPDVMRAIRILVKMTAHATSDNGEPVKLRWGELPGSPYERPLSIAALRLARACVLLASAKPEQLAEAEKELADLTETPPPTARRSVRLLVGRALIARVECALTARISEMRDPTAALKIASACMGWLARAEVMADELPPDDRARLFMLRGDLELLLGSRRSGRRQTEVMDDAEVAYYRGLGELGAGADPVLFGFLLCRLSELAMARANVEGNPDHRKLALAESWFDGCLLYHRMIGRARVRCASALRLTEAAIVLMEANPLMSEAEVSRRLQAAVANLREAEESAPEDLREPVCAISAQFAELALSRGWLWNGVDLQRVQRQGGPTNT